MSRQRNGELTRKEKEFCEEYVRNGGNASQAYYYAYDTTIENARKAYCKVYRKPEVKAYIRQLQAVEFEAACITAERIGLKLAEIAFSAKGDEVYNTTAQLKALDLLQKQLSLQHQNIQADVNTDINITIEE
jgi:phage terminase small subunit